MEQLDHVFRAGHEGIMNIIGGKHCPHRDGPVGKPLGRCHQIRLNPEIIHRKRRAKATETSDDFIKDQKDAMLGANFTQAFKIPFWRDQNAGGACNWLDNHGCNG